MFLNCDLKYYKKNNCMNTLPIILKIIVFNYLLQITFAYMEDDWTFYLNECKLNSKFNNNHNNNNNNNNCAKDNDKILIEERQFNKRHWCIVIDNHNDFYTNNILTLIYSSGYRIGWFFAEKIQSNEKLQSKLRLNKGLIRIVIFPFCDNSEFPKILSMKINEMELCSSPVRMLTDHQHQHQHNYHSHNYHIIDYANNESDETDDDNNNSLNHGKNYKYLYDCYNRKIKENKKLTMKKLHCNNISIEYRTFNNNNLECYWCINYKNTNQKYTKYVDKLVITYTDAAKNLAWIPSETYIDTDELLESVFHIKNNVKTTISVSANGDSIIPDILSIKLNDIELCTMLDDYDYTERKEILTLPDDNKSENNDNINFNVDDVFAASVDDDVIDEQQPSIIHQPNKNISIVSRIIMPKELNCGQRLLKHKTLIANGWETSNSDYPWHSAIYHHKTLEEKMYVCGGTLIDKKTILTAAHCLITSNGYLIIPERLTIELGRNDLKVSSIFTQEFQAYKVIPHENYNLDTIENDIAIIKLSTYVQLSNYVQIICLPTIDFDLMKTNGMVTGWGRDENNLQRTKLREASLPVVDKMECLKSNRAFYGQYLTETNFCAGHKNGTNVCRGDSGSGLVFNKDDHWYIGGITSLGLAIYGTEQCDITQYAIFTDVVKFVNWIKNYVDLDDV